MVAKIPTTVVTRFLGAGKTTLIRHMPENANGLKIALIINEFGYLGIDGEILADCGDATCSPGEITKLANGCICCTVADEFIPTMEKPRARAFNWPQISTHVTVDSVITVVDGRAVLDGQFAHNVCAIEAQRAGDDTLDHETPLSEFFDDQITCADMIVVNKSDLLDETNAEQLVQSLRIKARRGVQVIHTSMGALPLEVLLGQGSKSQGDMETRREVHHDHDHNHNGDHDHNAFESFVVTRAEIVDQAAFSPQLEQVIQTHNILRLKGFATIKGKPIRLTLQAVGPRIDCYFDRPLTASEPRETRLVVIGEAGLDQNTIQRALSA
ncbi:MAG: cobalamin biosynthesis protein CobW [Alphaproteobacteria bacterium]|nr:cobalamin biosynthesis protein CobW [Alphaproteobacteria bacterium]